MIRNIEKHYLCINMLSDNHLSMELTRICDESDIVGRLQNIAPEFIEKITGLASKHQGMVLANEIFREYVIDLLRKNVPIESIKNLLEEDEIITSFEYEHVERALLDEQVPAKYLLVYLKYYITMNLSSKQKENLWNSLEKLHVHDTDITELNKSEKRILCLPLLGSEFFQKVKNFSNLIKQIEKDYDLYLILKKLYTLNGLLKITDMLLEELTLNPSKINHLLQEVISYYEKQEQEMLLEYLFYNGSLLFDLQKLARTLPKCNAKERKMFIQSKTNYISAIYGKIFPNKPQRFVEERILIYAITHKKKHFLKLVEENFEVFQSLSSDSILFDKIFYEKVINLNILNLKNLKTCAELEYLEIREEHYGSRQYTFEEFDLLIRLPKEYVLLYNDLQISRVDSKLITMREITKRKLLFGITKQETLQTIAKLLSIKPLSSWKDSFKHIKGINAYLTIKLLSKYDSLHPYIGDICDINEANYLVNNHTSLINYTSLGEIRRNLLSFDADWKQLVETFKLNIKFIRKNEKQIYKFLYANGAYIVARYLNSNPSKQEQIRRLLTAELMGKFQDLKYHRDDLELELDFPIAKAQKAHWKNNLCLKDNQANLTVWEEDKFLPVLQIGEIPTHSCLSYIDGRYSECLLSCFDANKKIIFVKQDERIIFRAIVRLTKGNTKNPSSHLKSELQFVDLQKKKKEQRNETLKKDHLVIFLERPYTKNLSDIEKDSVYNLILKLLQLKGKEMGATLIASAAYESHFKTDRVVRSNYYIYISKSKAGVQYLDSLGGSKGVKDEGKFYGGSFCVVQ